jgi:sugar-specific transcriptional regulator TrmB
MNNNEEKRKQVLGEIFAKRSKAKQPHEVKPVILAREEPVNIEPMPKTAQEEPETKEKFYKTIYGFEGVEYENNGEIFNILSLRLNKKASVVETMANEGKIDGYFSKKVDYDYKINSFAKSKKQEVKRPHENIVKDISLKEDREGFNAYLRVHTLQDGKQYIKISKSVIVSDLTMREKFVFLCVLAECRGNYVFAGSKEKFCNAFGLVSGKRYSYIYNILDSLANKGFLTKKSDDKNVYYHLVKKYVNPSKDYIPVKMGVLKIFSKNKDLFIKTLTAVYFHSLFKGEKTNISGLARALNPEKPQRKQTLRFIDYLTENNVLSNRFIVWQNVFS